MQLSFTKDQIEIGKNVVEVVIMPVLSFVIRRWIRSAKKSLNEVITDNVNRVRTEVMLHIDHKFEAHETSAFNRLSAVEIAVARLTTASGNHLTIPPPNR